MENDNNVENNENLDAEIGQEGVENQGADPLYPETEENKEDSGGGGGEGEGEGGGSGDGVQLDNGEGTGDAPEDTPPVKEDTPPAPEKKPEATEKKDVVANISEKLGEEGKEEVNKSPVNPLETMPFDLSKLTMEQRQAMKAMLEATPDSVSKKVENPRVRIRKFGGKYIVNFKRAFLGLVRDHENNRDVERHQIPVLYKGEKEYQNILYANFINSDQVECEVTKQLQEPKKFIEGQTFNRKTGRMVEVTRTEVYQTFVIKLPDNEGEIEIEGKMANA